MSIKLIGKTIHGVPKGTRIEMVNDSPGQEILCVGGKPVASYTPELKELRLSPGYTVVEEHEPLTITLTPRVALDLYVLLFWCNGETEETQDVRRVIHKYLKGLDINNAAVGYGSTTLITGELDARVA